jgi:hypothetical protein
MAYYLALGNGASGENVTFASTISTASGAPFSVEFESNYTSTGNKDYAVLDDKGTFGCYVNATSVFFYVNGVNTQFQLTHNISNYTQRSIFKVVYDGTDLELFVDGVSEDVELSIGTGFLSTFGISTNNSRGSFNLYFLKITESGTLIHNYDPSASNGTGTTLEDTTGNNDGTLNSFVGTANSWWVFYSSGTTITVTAISTAQSISNVTLTQQHALASNDLLTDQALSNATLVVAGGLSVSPILTANLLSFPALIQANVLSVDAILTGQTISNVSLLVAGGLSVDDLQSANTISNALVIQQHLLNVDSISSLQTLSNITLAVDGQLIVAPIQNSQTISNAGLVSHLVLITNSITNEQLIGSITLNKESIGTVTAAFKDNAIGVEYGLATFTVKFKG